MIAVPKSQHKVVSVPRLTTPWATSESAREWYRTQVPRITVLKHRYYAFYHSAIFADSSADSRVVKGIISLSSFAALAAAFLGRFLEPELVVNALLQGHRI